MPLATSRRPDSSAYTSTRIQAATTPRETSTTWIETPPPMAVSLCRGELGPRVLLGDLDAAHHHLLRQQGDARLDRLRDAGREDEPHRVGVAHPEALGAVARPDAVVRSEERRVGRECRASAS